MSEQTETVVEEAVEVDVTSADANEAETTDDTTAVENTVVEPAIAAADVATEAIVSDSTGADTTVTDTIDEASELLAEGAQTAAGEVEAATDTASEAIASAPAAAATAEATETVAVETDATESVVTDSTGADTAVADTIDEASELLAAGAQAAAAAASADTAQSADAATAEDDGDDDGAAGKRVVRVLSVGQEVDGVVKRITEFGAFVDIGVGRDGLLHVSELSLQRVAKVADVLKQGQTITVWIKELDRERNRISLTMISPDTKTIRDLQEGELIQGTVSRIMPYGAFIDIGVGRDALLHVREMSDGFVKRPEDVVTLGESIEARIVSVSRRRQRIDLSLKGLRPEPEAEAAEAAATEAAEVREDPYENVEVLSPMELAFKRAMEGSDVDFEQTAKRGKRGKGRRQQNRAIQEEIIARTLGNR